MIPKQPTEFVLDLSSRLANRVQISSDSMKAYVEAIELGFGDNVDYGQIVKTYISEKPLPAVVGIALRLYFRLSNIRLWAIPKKKTSAQALSKDKI